MEGIFIYGRLGGNMLTTELRLTPFSYTHPASFNFRLSMLIFLNVLPALRGP
jgi:hypothetical protein